MTRPLTLAELRQHSRAYDAFMVQVRAANLAASSREAAVQALTGDDSGPLAFDLMAIHQAALEDPDCRHISQHGDGPASRAWFTPRRYIREWDHLVRAFDATDDGRILVDRNVALDFTMRRDARVMGAVIDDHIKAQKAAAAADPIGNAVQAARGGPFAMLFARADSAHLGLDDAGFAAAVMERAKAEAAGMDDYAAERLLSDVRKALGIGGGL